MKRYLLDTGIAAQFFERRQPIYQRADDATQRGIRVGIAIPVVAELSAGAENSSTRHRNLPALRQTLLGIRTWPFDRKAAEEFGRLFAFLKRNGRQMGQNYIQIAAIAISLGGTVLVTKDSDFAAIPGLTIEDWPKL